MRNATPTDIVLADVFEPGKIVFYKKLNEVHLGTILSVSLDLYKGISYGFNTVFTYPDAIVFGSAQAAYNSILDDLKTLQEEALASMEEAYSKFNDYQQRGEPK